MPAKPKLQLALDQFSLPDALVCAERLAPHVDILEAGTLLCLSAGFPALRALRQYYPHHTLVADFKVADAGDVLAQQAFAQGAQWMTVMCAAPLATIAAAQAVAEVSGGEIQIELFGHWTLEEAKAWHRLGVRQAIYHRGRDAQASGQQWCPQDLDRMKALSDVGLSLSVTGGLTASSLSLFRHIDVTAFIAGRALAQAPDPQAAAEAFHRAIAENWRA